MTGDRAWDLAQLTLAACEELLGQDFVRPNDQGPAVVLRLQQVAKVRRDPVAADGGDRPFSLVFRGPADPRLTQGRHDLDHPLRPLPGVFLVQIDGDQHHALYEAVFA